MKEYLVGKYQKMTARIFAKYINAERMIGVYNGMVMFALEILTGFIYVYISCKALRGAFRSGRWLCMPGDRYDDQCDSEYDGVKNTDQLFQ